MSVGRRLVLSLLALVVCTAVVGGAGLVGLVTLSNHARASDHHHRALRSMYEIGFHAAAVRELIGAGDHTDAAIRRHLFLASQEADRLGALTPDARIAALRASITERVRRADGALDGSATGLEADANRWLGEVAAMVSDAHHRIVENQRIAAARFRTAVGVMAGLFGLSVFVAIVVGVRQYRSVMGPVRTLDEAMHTIGGGGLGHRIPERGDREFARMAHRFNEMSAAIQELHESMQRQVEMKSRQLLRSEQLASVGSLAAGLAHEINNPLGIIAGYAQTSLRRFDRATSDEERAEAAERAEQTLRIVCEEAFRCRDIALHLVRMAQPPESDPEAVVVDPVVRRAIDLVGHLPAAKNREIVYRIDPSCADSACSGRAAQLVQVVMNLVINALEACPAEGGRVLVGVRRREGSIVISVEDNGRGMTPEVVARAFDPFFTDKPRRGLDGCGLGLAVSHAIIERHHGRVFAHSEGPGTGSTFTVELPIRSGSADTHPQAQEPMHA